MRCILNFWILFDEKNFTQQLSLPLNLLLGSVFIGMRLLFGETFLRMYELI